MSDYPGERRRYQRVAIDLPVEVQQGGSVWKQRLIDISVAGLATDQPDVWDAQYNEPFTLVVDAGAHGELELHAWLQHVEAGRLGFTVQSVDQEARTALRALLIEHFSDPAELDGEFAKLDQSD
jgi:hypothetical protein